MGKPVIGSHGRGTSSKELERMNSKIEAKWEN